MIGVQNLVNCFKRSFEPPYVQFPDPNKKKSLIIGYHLLQIIIFRPHSIKNNYYPRKTNLKQFWYRFTRKCKKPSYEKMHAQRRYICQTVLICGRHLLRLMREVTKYAEIRQFRFQLGKPNIPGPRGHVFDQVPSLSNIEFLSREQSFIDSKMSRAPV